MEWIGRARTSGHVLITCSPTIDSSPSQIESIHHPPNQAPRRSHRITPGAGRWTHSNHKITYLITKNLIFLDILAVLLRIKIT